MLSVALATFAVVLGSPGASSQSSNQCESSAQFGALLDRGEFDAAVVALPPEALNPLASRFASVPKVTLRNLPAVAQQGTTDSPGSPGTCEAQSFGYGLGSYTAARDVLGFPKWNAALPQNSISAAYLYTLAHIQENKSCPSGSLALGYLAQLTTLGAPSRALVPYSAICGELNKIPSQPLFPDAYPGMRRFRIGSYATFEIDGNPNAINLIKAFIRNGQPVAFSGKVLCGYGNSPVFENGVIYETATIPDSGHGQLVVGYDDSVGKDGAKGALLVQNSFGTHWPPGSGSAAPAGMAYWSYNSFSSTQMLAAVAFPRSDLIFGLPLKASTAAAPRGVITWSWQWTPGSASPESYLILGHGFTNPVKLQSVTLVEPNGSKVMATAAYGQPISLGYSYLKRSDGKAFLSGVYGVKLDAVEAGGTTVTYTGWIVLGGSKSGAKTEASMLGAEITGSTGATAQVSN